MKSEDFIQDNQLAYFLQKKIAESPIQVRTQLRSIEMCGKRLIPVKGEKEAVVLLTDGEKSKFAGIGFCDNVWICPNCQARWMSDYGERIKLALDNLKKSGYKAVMATFTFPHLSFITCREGILLLRQLKQNFMKKTKGTTVTQFFEDCGIKHYVWSAEFTYGRNGWHPHYHTLFWVKSENFNKVLSWEKRLKDLWLKTAKKYLLQYKPTWKATIEKLFNITSKTVAYDRGGVFFSKDNKGQIREITSSNYLVGWSASKELTGLERKKGAQYHYTPRQLLEKAYFGDNKSWCTFLEYALATKLKPGIRRVQFSAGLCKQIKAWKQTKKAKEFVKKKETANFRPVVWFSYENWKYICYEMDFWTRSNILYLARYPNLLFDYLDNLKVPYNLPAANRLCSIIADAYNDAC